MYPTNPFQRPISPPSSDEEDEITPSPTPMELSPNASSSMSVNTLTASVSSTNEVASGLLEATSNEANKIPPAASSNAATSHLVNKRHDAQLQMERENKLAHLDGHLEFIPFDPYRCETSSQNDGSASQSDSDEEQTVDGETEDDDSTKTEVKCAIQSYRTLDGPLVAKTERAPNRSRRESRTQSDEEREANDAAIREEEKAKLRFSPTSRARRIALIENFKQCDPAGKMHVKSIIEKSSSDTTDYVEMYDSYIPKFPRFFEISNKAVENLERYFDDPDAVRDLISSLIQQRRGFTDHGFSRTGNV